MTERRPTPRLYGRDRPRRERATVVAGALALWALAFVGLFELAGPAADGVFLVLLSRAGDGTRVEVRVPVTTTLA